MHTKPFGPYDVPYHVSGGVPRMTRSRKVRTLPRLERFLAEYRRVHPDAAHYLHPGSCGSGPEQLPNKLVGTTGPRQVLIAASRVRLLEPVVLDTMLARSGALDLKYPKDPKHQLLDQRSYKTRAEERVEQIQNTQFEPFCPSVKVRFRGRPRCAPSLHERYRVQRALWRIFAHCEALGAFHDEFKNFTPSKKDSGDGYNDPVAIYPRDLCLWMNTLKHVMAEEKKTPRYGFMCGYWEPDTCVWQFLPGGEYDCVFYTLCDILGCSPVTFFFLSHGPLGEKYKRTSQVLGKSMNTIAVKYGHQPDLALYKLWKRPKTFPNSSIRSQACSTRWTKPPIRARPWHSRCCSSLGTELPSHSCRETFGPCRVSGSPSGVRNGFVASDLSLSRQIPQRMTPLSRRAVCVHSTPYAVFGAL